MWWHHLFPFESKLFFAFVFFDWGSNQILDNFETLPQHRYWIIRRLLLLIPFLRLYLILLLRHNKCTPIQALPIWTTLFLVANVHKFTRLGSYMINCLQVFELIWYTGLLDLSWSYGWHGVIKWFLSFCIAADAVNLLIFNVYVNHANFFAILLFFFRAIFIL